MFNRNFAVRRTREQLERVVSLAEKGIVAGA
jgi:hypothetical protein